VAEARWTYFFTYDKCDAGASIGIIRKSSKDIFDKKMTSIQAVARLFQRDKISGLMEALLAMEFQRKGQSSQEI
jgi:hypothetical protein